MDFLPPRGNAMDGFSDCSDPLQLPSFDVVIQRHSESQASQWAVDEASKQGGGGGGMVFCVMLSRKKTGP